MYRKAIDGGIWIPKHGPRQPSPQGFTIGKDWNHYYKILDKCQFRKIEEKIKSSCGCRSEEWSCSKEGEPKQISRVICEQCQADWWRTEYPFAIDYTK